MALDQKKDTHAVSKSGCESKESVQTTTDAANKKQSLVLVGETPTFQSFLREDTMRLIMEVLKSGRFFWKPEIEKFALERKEHPGYVYAFVNAVMNFMRTFPKCRSMVYVSDQDKKKKTIACPSFANPYELSDCRFSAMDMHRYWVYREWDLGTLVEYSRTIVDHSNRNVNETAYTLHESLFMLNECLARILALVKQKCINSLAELVSFRCHLLYSPALGVSNSCKDEFLRTDKETFIAMIKLYFQLECKQVVPMFYQPCAVIIDAMSELARRWKRIVNGSSVLDTKNQSINQKLELPVVFSFKMKIRVVTFGSCLKLDGTEYRFLKGVLTGDFGEIQAVTKSFTRKPDPILVSFLKNISEFIGSVCFVRECSTIQVNTTNAIILHKFLENNLLSNPVLPIFPSRRIPFVCAVCFHTAAKLCGRCHRVRYCSSFCQKIHWKSGHKTNCSVHCDRKTNHETVLFELD